MKMVSLSFFFGVLLTTSVFTQSGRISKFSVTGSGNSNVLIRWAMNAGSTCRTLELQRSTDKISFNSIYQYPGICGGSEEETSYTWVDNFPLAGQWVYYRIKLTEGEYSSLDSIQLDQISNTNLISVTPNPSNGVFNIQLNSNDGISFDWKIFSQNGQILTQGLETNAHSFVIDLSGFQSSIYILKLYFKDGSEEGVQLNLVR